MSVANEVDSAFAYLYPGEDKAFNFIPDASADESGIPVASWTIEARLCRGRTNLLPEIQPDVYTIALPYVAEDDPDPEMFSGMLTSTQTATLTPGPWTLEVWRTNSGAKQMVFRFDLTVPATILL